MQVKGLDHVNIIAADLDETCRFYESVLGFRVGERPAIAAKFKGAWLLDDTDHPLLHVAAYDPDRHGAKDRMGRPTGSIDHVALACDDFDDTIARCEAMGVPHRVNSLPNMSFRQIVVHDPNNIMIELNFAGD